MSNENGTAETQPPDPPAKETTKKNRHRLLRSMHPWNQLEASRYYGVSPIAKLIYFGSAEQDVEGNESGVAAHETGGFIMNLHFLIAYLAGAPKEEREITVIINSPGGDEYHSFALYDEIVATRKKGFKITAIGTGMVMSAASLMFQAADTRIMRPHATMLIHNGTWSFGEQNAIDAERSGEESKRVRAIYRNIYWERMKERNPECTEDQVDELLRFDTFLSAERSVEIGLADTTEG